MLKEKWKKLPLRQKVLFISGILVILSIPLSLITLYFMAISMTFFVVSVFYNLYKFMKIADLSISYVIDINTQKAEKDFQEGKKISGTVRIISLPLAVSLGIPMILILLICLWIAI